MTIEDDRIYPKLDDRTISALAMIRRYLDEDPKFLQNEKCPYSPTAIQLLELFFRPKVEVPVKAPPPEVVGEVDLEQEMQLLLNQLKGLGNSLDDTVADQLKYVTTATKLIEKILELKERAANVKAVVDFEKRVIDVLQDICDPNTRSKFMDRIAEIVAA